MRKHSINVIPRCIEGCNGGHLATPENGPGECDVFRVVGWTTHDICRDPQAMSVAYKRHADPEEGAGGYVNISLDTTDGENVSFTAAEARKLAEMLLHAADRLDDAAIRDALVVASWDEFAA